MDPLSDFRDLAPPAPVAPDAAATETPVFDAAAVDAAVGATSARVLVVYGPPLSGRTTLAALVCARVRAHTPAHLPTVDATYEHAAVTHATLAARARERARSTPGTTVLLAHTRVDAPCALSMRTTDFYSPALVRRHFGASVAALRRTYHSNLLALRNHRAFGIAPVARAAAARAPPPHSAHDMERWYHRHRTRARRSAAALADAFSDADLLIARVERLECGPDALGEAIVDALLAYPSAHASHPCGDDRG